MSCQPEHRDPDELSVPEKILRVQDLWDDIARSPRDVEITPAQREEAELQRIGEDVSALVDAAAGDTNEALEEVA